MKTAQEIWEHLQKDMEVGNAIKGIIPFDVPSYSSANSLVSNKVRDFTQLSQKTSEAIAFIYVLINPSRFLGKDWALDEISKAIERENPWDLSFSI